jgi:hypothetical protein
MSALTGVRGGDDIGVDPDLDISTEGEAHEEKAM